MIIYLYIMNVIYNAFSAMLRVKFFYAKELENYPDNL